MRMRASVAFLFPLAVVLVAGAVAGVSAPVLAQMAAVKPAAPDWDKLADQTLAAVKAQYGLSDEQVQKIRPLLRAHLPKMRSLFDSYAGQSLDLGPALLKEYQATRAEFKAKVDPILTEPQRKDFMAIRAQFDQEMKKAFIEGRLKWLQSAIGVDAAQSEKLRPIVTESFDKRLELFANANSNAASDAKDPAAAQKDLRIQLQILQGETDEKMKTVLTPEQMGRYQDSRSTTAAPAEAAKQQGQKPQTH